MKFRLNRLDMVGDIDQNTPIEVIKDLAKHCGNVKDSDVETKTGEVIKFIREYKPFEIDLTKKIYTHEELREISLYVSFKEVAWSMKELLLSFKDLIDFQMNPKLPSSSFIVSSRSRNNLYAIDTIMLYKLCKINNIKTERSDGIYKLSNIVHMLRKDENEIISEILSGISRYNKSELVELYSLLKYKEKGDYVFNENSLLELKKLNNKSKILLNKTLFSNEEAIVQGFIHFNIDLTESSCPNSELLELYKYRRKYGKNFLEEYIPVLKDNFQKNYQLNRDFYNVTKYWKPYFENIYTKQQLQKLSGNNTDTIEDLKQRLYLEQLQKKFYRGIIPSCEYKDTFIYMTPLKELRGNEVISYGILYDRKMIALTPKEIIDHFNSANSFRDFEEESEKLSQNNINQLRHICFLYPMSEDYIVLLNLLIKIQNHENIKNEEINMYIELWKNGSDETKEKLDRINMLILETSMYMRGWRIENQHKFPLSVQECNNADIVDKEGKIDVNVKTSVLRLYEEIKNLDSKSAEIVLNLPLIKFDDRNKSFYKSTKKEQGLTVFERIEIVMDINNNNSDNIYSCRRLSSNYIAISAYHFHSLLHNDELFPLNEFKMVL